MPIQKRLIGLAVNMMVAVAFGLVPIAGGGVAPIGIILLMGLTRETAWGLPLAIGWAGIVALFVACVVPGRFAYGIFTLLGLAGLVASWATFLWMSDHPRFSLPLSIPFVAVVLARGYYLYDEVFGKPLVSE
ncbi:MAG: hypothetical protein U0744_14670 [Gemmataceae bacterium]